jgi:hypothetical protein
MLRAYPAQLTITELVRELTAASDDFEVCDATESAIRELLAAGLLHRSGEFIVPARAAVRMAELFDLAE